MLNLIDMLFILKLKASFKNVLMEFKKLLQTMHETKTPKEKYIPREKIIILR